MTDDLVTWRTGPRVSDADFERLLRERYEPILTPEAYATLRRACGLGDLIEGECTERPA